MRTSHHDIPAGTTSEQFWEPYYSGGSSRWSGKANASLVEELEGVTPGTALDLGCGQGGDAIWLAAAGWTVTAVDVAQSALDVAAALAAEAGVSGAISWERHDLAATFPAGSFDLVASTFMHSPVAFPRTQVLKAAAAAVRPGGTLLVIGHAPSPEHQHDLQTAQELADDLALPAAEWQVRTCGLVDRVHTFGDGETAERTDAVLRLQRRSRD
ncbi:hypothetical protein DSM112329_03572 [Paraconexibacter sp. AEG42_29]|uniref:Methyltransferase domain-containing protein n=1 Tax=Paraconexibacter sp. AEG42_29 TaxID=2997339 RepID=A0AAU7AYK5_9ACTN